MAHFVWLLIALAKGTWNRRNCKSIPFTSSQTVSIIKTWADFKTRVFFKLVLVNTLIFSSWERIPPLELPESNNQPHSNNELPGSHLWPILFGFSLLEQKENETEAIASPVPLHTKKQFTESWGFASIKGLATINSVFPPKPKCSKNQLIFY